MWIAGAFFTICFIVSVVIEPRRFRCAVFLLAAVLTWGLAFLVYAFPIRDGETLGAYVLLGLIALVVVVIFVLGIVLILNGFTMVRREGRRLANLLGLFLGLLLVVYVGLSVTAAMTNSAGIAVWVVFLGIPFGYLGYGFTAYLLYSSVYQWVTKRWVTTRWAKPPAAVVVLGSGLIRNKVPPLLASRLDKGMAVASHSRGSANEPVFVVSGGKGSDEQRTEASAMAEYLVSKGIDENTILQEDLSRTTRENLTNTKALLASQEITGPIAAVTNNFHAFRAALLLCREKIPGYAIGSPTAHYYWPAATIREYAAILLDSRTFNIVCLSISVIPLIILGLTALV